MDLYADDTNADVSILKTIIQRYKQIGLWYLSFPFENGSLRDGTLGSKIAQAIMLYRFHGMANPWHHCRGMF
jgi:hypothetical protein